MSLKNVFNHNSNSQLNTILSKTEKQFSVRYGIQRFINVDRGLYATVTDCV